MTQPPDPADTPQLDQHLAHFQWRVLQDALTEATADYWEKRATTLDWARPRRDDYHGQATDEPARHRELTRIADQCRFHAALLRERGLDTEAQAAIALVLTERHTENQVA